jgi:hypothetical protein
MRTVEDLRLLCMARPFASSSVELYVDRAFVAVRGYLSEVHLPEVHLPEVHLPEVSKVQLYLPPEAVVHLESDLQIPHPHFQLERASCLR